MHAHACKCGRVMGVCWAWAAFHNTRIAFVTFPYVYTCTARVKNVANIANTSTIAYSCIIFILKWFIRNTQNIMEIAAVFFVTEEYFIRTVAVLLSEHSI